MLICPAAGFCRHFSRWSTVLTLATTLSLPAAASAQGTFRRGDSNADARVDIADGVHVLSYLFLGGSSPVCQDAADANDDGRLDIADAIFTFAYLFNGGKVPPPPGPLTAGADPSADGLGCGPEEVRFESPPLTPPAAPYRRPLGGRIVEVGATPGEGSAFWKTKKGHRLIFDDERFRSVPGIPSPEDHLQRLLVDLYQEEVMRLPGRGLDLAWVLTHRNRSDHRTLQGNGWDFSYDLRVERRPEGVVLFDGTGRHDLFRKGDDGTYAAPGLFQEGREEADGTLTFTFPDGGSWRFPWMEVPDGGQGRILSIRDRNGNEIGFEHGYRQNQTDLEFIRVRSSLGGTVTAAIGEQGLLEKLIDFNGREVRFEYYRDGDSGGSAGDLKSITRAAPPGDPTPPRSTLFTYTRGFPDERLNHDLLTVTDPRGQTFLTREISTATDPRDPSFDRVTARSWGAGGERGREKFGYFAVAPSPENGGAVLQVLVNDMAGNVLEWMLDDAERVVVERRYTGRANPALPTTPGGNRPAGKLRPADPDFFETRYQYNSDSLLSGIRLPRGNEVAFLYRGDLAPGAPPRARGLVETVKSSGGVAGPEVITLELEHDPKVNQTSRMVDARGNATSFEYDSRGNLVGLIERISTSVHQYEYNSFGQLAAHLHPPDGSGHRRRDEFQYASGPDGRDGGLLSSQVVDANGLALVTRFEYDPRGNLTAVTDPRGNVTRHEYNAFDELVKVVSPPVAARTATLRIFRDPNGNIVRTDLDNLDEEGKARPNAQLSTLYEYDSLNRLTARFEEVGNADPGPEQLDGSRLPLEEFRLTRYRYDPNGNPSSVRMFGGKGEPGDALRLSWDERGLLFESARGGQELAEVHHYDGNGNRVRVLLAPDHLRFTAEYDGLDRPVRVTDPMGNGLVIGYDPNGNPVSESVEGEAADAPGSEKNVRLSETIWEHDAMDRPIRRDRLLGEPAPGGLAEPVPLTSRWEWSDLSQLVLAANPLGGETRFAYDGAGRLSRTTDAAGNTSSFEYDGNGNLIRQVDGELDAEGIVHSFAVAYEHDALDRTVLVRNDLDRLVSYRWDSSSNLVAVATGSGESRFTLDGLGRLVKLVRTGEAGESGETVTTRKVDAASRLVEETDPNGNVTAYSYDTLGRMTAAAAADGTVHRFVWNALGDLGSETGAAGTVVRYTYDSLGRPVRKDITPGGGVSAATTFERFVYDGLSRLVEAENDASRVGFAHDSLSRLTSETVNGRTAAYTYEPDGSLTFLPPGGTEELRYVSDALGRVSAVGRRDHRQSIRMASVEFTGRWRPAERRFLNGIRTSWSYDGARLPVRVTHQLGAESAAVVVDDHSHAWDETQRQVERGDLLTGGLVRLYGFDGSHRLLRSRAGVPGAVPAIIDYLLDAAGNRSSVQGGPEAGDYLLDATVPEPADHQVNQYTRTPFDERTYDAAGNLVRLVEAGDSGRTLSFEYDYAGRLVLIDEGASGRSAAYTYDALGRRIAKGIAQVGLGVARTTLFYQGRRLVAETGEDTARGAVYLYAGGQPIAARGDLDGDGSSEDRYFLEDGAGKLTAAAGAQAEVIEKYDYQDFAKPLFFDGGGKPIPGSLIRNPLLLDPAVHDAESGFYLLDGFHFDPRSGQSLNTRRGRFTRSWESVADPHLGIEKTIARGETFPPALAPRRSGVFLPGDSPLPSYFREATGLDVYLDLIEVQEGGKNDGPHQRPGPTRFSHLVLKRGATKSKAFFDWVAGAVNREVKRMGGKIALCKRDGSPVLEWSFENGFPAKWEGPDLDASKSEISIETVEIAHEGLGFAPRGSGGGGGGRAGSPADRTAIEDFEKNTENVSGGFGLKGTVLGSVWNDKDRPPTFSQVPRPRNPEGDPYRMSDNGWGSCFNCHPFGLADGAARTRHDTVKNAIGNVR